MTDQEKAKAQIERLERQKGVALWKDELLELLRPVAEGKSVIVPVEPTAKIMKAGYYVPQYLGQIDNQKELHKAKCEGMYRAMITAAQEKE